MVRFLLGNQIEPGYSTLTTTVARLLKKLMSKTGGAGGGGGSASSSELSDSPLPCLTAGTIDHAHEAQPSDPSSGGLSKFSAGLSGKISINLELSAHDKITISNQLCLMHPLMENN